MFTLEPIRTIRDADDPRPQRFAQCPIPDQELEDLLRRMQVACQRYWGDWGRVLAVVRAMRSWDHSQQTLASTLIDDLPPEVFHPNLRGRLDEMGVLTVADLCEAPLDQLAELRGFGPRVLEQINALRERIELEQA